MTTAASGAKILSFAAQTFCLCGLQAVNRLCEEKAMLPEELAVESRRVVGTKQVLRALEEGRLARAFVAKDADLTLTQRVVDRCYSRDIPCQEVPAMRELGRACGIDVKAACAGLLRA